MAPSVNWQPVYTSVSTWVNAFTVDNILWVFLNFHYRRTLEFCLAFLSSCILGGERAEFSLCLSPIHLIHDLIFHRHHSEILEMTACYGEVMADMHAVLTAKILYWGESKMAHGLL